MPVGHTEEMKERIRREIHSIADLKERAAFKELMEEVFLALYETNETMYRQLEERVMNDLAYDINRYQIRTGLVERSLADRSDRLLYPVFEDDLKTPEYKVKQLREEIAREGKAYLVTVFVCCDSLVLDDFYRNQDTFSGRIRAGAEYPVSICAERNRRYLSEVEHLYHLFIKNGVPWKTVNAPYFYKMADIYLTKLPDEVPDGEAVTKFGADFGEYNSFVRYEMVPLWNIRRLKLDSVGFPVACGDYENYEHTISVREYGKGHAYLVEEKSGIRHVRQSGDKLLITGAVSSAKKWDVYLIYGGAAGRIARYTYPMMENFRNDGFAERFERRMGQSVKTKGELRRFILGFGLEEYIEYQDCAVREQETEEIETYPMNFFLQDEVRGTGDRKLLVLYFRPQSPDTWLLRDLASFVASEVQTLYPEYRCGGKLV